MAYDAERGRSASALVERWLAAFVPADPGVVDVRRRGAVLPENRRQRAGCFGRGGRRARLRGGLEGRDQPVAGDGPDVLRPGRGHMDHRAHPRAALMGLPDARFEPGADPADRLGHPERAREPAALGRRALDHHGRRVGVAQLKCCTNFVDFFGVERLTTAFGHHGVARESDTQLDTLPEIASCFTLLVKPIQTDRDAGLLLLFSLQLTRCVPASAARVRLNDAGLRLEAVTSAEVTCHERGNAFFHERSRGQLRRRLAYGWERRYGILPVGVGQRDHSHALSSLRMSLLAFLQCQQSAPLLGSYKGWYHFYYQPQSTATLMS
ncbi:hypothetical protein D3C72_527700 [compost metagenome]